MTAQIERYLYLIQQVGSRYYFVAGIAFFFFYILFRSRIQHRKIQIKFPSNRDYWREIFYSSFTIFLFALVPYFLVFNPAVRPYTQLYSQISERGWLYYFALFPVLFFIHDTYFYWIHRLMHHLHN